MLRQDYRINLVKQKKMVSLGARCYAFLLLCGTGCRVEFRFHGFIRKS